MPRWTAKRTTTTFDDDVVAAIQKERAKELARGIDVGFNEMANRLLREQLGLKAKVIPVGGA